MRTYFFLIIVSLSFQCCYKGQEKGPESSLYLRLQLESERRLFPFPTGQSCFLQKNTDHNFLQIPKAQEVSDTDLSWTFQGPIGISGRMLCLAINPQDTQEIWAGSASGGLWKSQTGGIGPEAWKPVRTGYAVSSFSALAVNPDSGHIILAGTGEIYNSNNSSQGRFYRTLRGFSGIGILKSRDRGKTWQLSLDWSEYEDRGINRIAFDPSDTRIVYAATTHGLYQSQNGGNDWQLILDKSMVADILIHSYNGSLLTASVGGIGATDYGIFTSNDRGLSWTKIPYQNGSIRQGKIMIAQQNSNPDRIYAIFSDQFKTIGFMRTPDRFRTIFQHNIPDISSYQGWYARGMAIHEENSSSVLAGGVDLFLDERSFGNQFKRLYASETKVHVDFHDIIKNPQNSNSVYFCTDGGIFRSDDFGKSFYECNGGLHTTQFYTGDFENTSNGRILGGLQDNQTAFRDDSGKWKKVASGDGAYCYFHPTDPKTQYYSAQNLNIFRTSDSGNSWSELLRPSANSSFISPFIMHPQFGDLLAGASDRIFISTNRGDKWSENPAMLDGNFVHVLNMHPSDPDFIIYTGISKSSSELKIMASRNMGQDFDNIGKNLPNRYVTDIEFLPADPDIIAISMDGFLNDHIYLSKNGGSSWSNPGKGLPDIPVHCILFHPESSKIIYAGNGFGLFVTWDEGESWYNATDSTMDAIPVYDLKLLKEENKIGIFTHGRGVFTCNLIKQTISSTRPDIPKFQDLAYAFSEDHFRSIFIQNDAGVLISGDGVIKSMTSQQVIKNWTSLPPGIYYFITGQKKVKCLIGFQ